MKITKIIAFAAITAFLGAFTSCSDDDNGILPINNKCLKRTQGPNLVGNDIYFAYAMAMPYGSDQLDECVVEASIAGAEETWMENNSYYTNTSGQDVPVHVGQPSYNEGNRTIVKFDVDTCAATLRYYYRIPEEARGKEVSFKFSARSRGGKTISMNMGPYTISKQYMVRDLTLSRTACYISIEDMAVYTLDEAREHPEKIDLVYLWRNKISEGIDFYHTFAAPCADKEYTDNLEIPEGMNNNVFLRKNWGIIDGHLTDEPDNGTYIDDIDFETIQLRDMPNYAINMKEKGGMWIETEDGRYRAYIYINSLKSTSGGTISIKRYNMV